ADAAAANADVRQIFLGEYPLELRPQLRTARERYTQTDCFRWLDTCRGCLIEIVCASQQPLACILRRGDARDVDRNALPVQRRDFPLHYRLEPSVLNRDQPRAPHAMLTRVKSGRRA